MKHKLSTVERWVLSFLRFAKRPLRETKILRVLTRNPSHYTDSDIALALSALRDRGLIESKQIMAFAIKGFGPVTLWRAKPNRLCLLDLRQLSERERFAYGMFYRRRVYRVNCGLRLEKHFRCGHIYTTALWDTESATIRRQILDCFPGWEIEGYAIAHDPRKPDLLKATKRAEATYSTRAPVNNLMHGLVETMHKQHKALIEAGATFIAPDCYIFDRPLPLGMLRRFFEPR